MSYENRLKTVTLISGADYSDGSAHYRFIKLTSTPGTFVRCSVAGEDADGVCQDEPGSDHASCIAIGGISKVVAGAAITAGAKITTDDQGRAVTATTGNSVLGIAIHDAAAAGIIIPVLVEKNGQAA
ncbi:MAG: DUF2190 family protein [Allorhizobium sp.]